MEQKQLAVVYCCSEDTYAFPLATSIMSFEATNPKLADNYIIFCDGKNLTEETRTTLRKITHKITFQDFSEEEVLKRFLYVDEQLVKRYSYLMYAKVFLIDLLKQYKNVLFLGGDTIIVSDISELLTTGPLSWEGWGRYITPENTSEVYDRPNGDFIFMNEGVRDFDSNDLIKILNREFDQFNDPVIQENYSLGTDDERAFGMLALLNKIKIHHLKNFFVTPYSEALDEAKIIHAHHSKFWQYDVLRIVVPEYYQYYERWLALGGKGYEGRLFNPGNFPKKRYEILFYFRWMELVVRITDFLYDKLPKDIRPTLAIYNRLIPFYILGKNKTDCFYYIYLSPVNTGKFDRIHTGFQWRGEVTESVRQLMKRMVEASGGNYNLVDRKKNIVIFRESGAILRPLLAFLPIWQNMAQDFANFINKTLPILKESPDGNCEKHDYRS